MGHSLNTTTQPVVGQRDLRGFEKCFVAPEIYERPDAADRRGSLVRIVSGEIIPRLLRLHTVVLPDAAAD